MPQLSVILPVFNQNAAYLGQAIESVLTQTFGDFELLIIDDGSTEKDCVSALQTYAKKDLRIRLIRNPENRGIVFSLNRGLSIASGTYIARMDSDDIALPKRFEKQIAFLKKHSSVDLVGTGARIIDEQGKDIGSMSPPSQGSVLRQNILRRNFFIHPTWMFRSSLLSSVKNYREDAHGTEDYDFLLRIARRHGIANISEPLLKYRFNEKGITFKKNKRQEWNALKLRVKAIREYGYPKWQILFLIQPLLLFVFLPWFLKRLLLKQFFKKS